MPKYVDYSIGIGNRGARGHVPPPPEI